MKKTLRLAKETVRALGTQDLADVVGGNHHSAAATFCHRSANGAATCHLSVAANATTCVHSANAAATCRLTL